MTIEQEEIFKRYQNKGFSEDQLLEIKQGLEEGFDISVYARTGIPAADMAYIRKYLFYKKEIKEESVPSEESPEDIENQFEIYKETLQLTVYEKVVAFAVTIAGLAIIAAFYVMIMCLPVK